MSGSEFLGRWSRRKRADGAPSSDAAPTNVADRSHAAEDAIDAGGNGDASTGDARVADPSPQAHVAAPEASPLTDADMVPLETLDGGSDLSAFFSEGVSGSLRRAALRRVFHAPKFNVRDGLNDYDGDFTSFEPLGDIVTSDMKFRTAREEAARLRELAEPEHDPSASEAADAHALARDDDRADADAAGATSEDAPADASPDAVTAEPMDAVTDAPDDHPAGPPA